MYKQSMERDTGEVGSRPSTRRQRDSHGILERDTSDRLIFRDEPRSKSQGY